MQIRGLQRPLNSIAARFSLRARHAKHVHYIPKLHVVFAAWRRGGINHPVVAGLAADLRREVDQGFDVYSLVESYLHDNENNVRVRGACVCLGGGGP